MNHVYFLASLAGLTMATMGQAQTPAWRFDWQTGKVFTYRVEQTTSVVETAEGKKTETNAKVNQTKRWQVVGVDGSGVATVQLTLTALRYETKTPGGNTLLFDSANPAQAPAEMREQFSKYLNTPLVVLRVDARGKVVEVKESKFGPASRYESELPFVAVVPEGAAQANQTWERAYAVTLEPPQGTGEKFEAVQKYVCKQVQDGLATMAVTTAFKKLPEALADQVPLLQYQPEGEVVFDLSSGRMRSARMTVKKELKDHLGEGSSHQFQSSYVEEYVGAN